MKFWLLPYLFFFLISLAAFGQQEAEKAWNYLNKRGEVYFSFPYPGKSSLVEIERIISIDKVSADSVFAYATVSEFPVFELRGIPYKVLVPAGENFYPKSLASGNWDFYPSFSDYEQLLHDFESNYPQLCKLFSIGQSVGNRDLYFVRISSTLKYSAEKPRVMYTSSMHGDELVGYVMMLRMIDFLLSNYGSDDMITRLVDELEIYINPLFNPDGALFGGEGNNIVAPRRSNANNKDLNRNFPDPRAGEFPGGERQPETMALMSFLDTILITLSVNFHGGAEVVNFPWDTWVKRHADHDWFRSVSKQYADTVHFYSPPGYFRTPSPQGFIKGSDWYIVTGSQQDYITYFRGGREVIIELSNNKYPDPATLPDYWEYNYRSMLRFMDQALYGLKGTVSNKLTGDPIVARIELLDFDTDSSWTYSRPGSGIFFRPAAPRVYSVKTSSPGYQSRIFNIVQVFENQSTQLDIQLEPEKLPVSGDSVFVLPNPVISSGYLIIRNSKSSIMRIDIYDKTGRKIFSFPTQEYTEGETILPLDASNLRPGLNLVRIQTESHATTKKLLYLPPNNL